MSFNEALTELKITLPKPAKPVGSYSAFKILGKQVFISGQLPIDIKGSMIKGTVGQDIQLVDAKKAAYLCCLNILSQLKEACGGDLNKVKNCIKITGYVNSDNNFINQADVLNSASELLTKVFGKSGIHARAAISVNSFPLGAAVEIESIFEIN